jgi:hypothetical protein
MKISKRKLKRIIREEVRRVVEAREMPGAPPARELEKGVDPSNPVHAAAFVGLALEKAGYGVQYYKKADDAEIKINGGDLGDYFEIYFSSRMTGYADITDTEDTPLGDFEIPTRAIEQGDLRTTAKAAERDLEEADYELEQLKDMWY